MDIPGYLNQIRDVAKNPQATEHSYRPALEGLFRSIDDDVTVINEPKQSAVGAPDFVFARNGVSIGWCEAKDIHKEITKFRAGDRNREQKERYKKGLPNLIYTNGTDFEFIREGEVTGFVSIADLIPALPARPQEFPRLEMMLRDFSAQTPISINSAKQLAQMMAGKAVLIKDFMGNALVADQASGADTELIGQYEGFKKSLIHDTTIADFADVYAETIAYGLFAARLHDHSLGTFNRAEALELLPKSNPFLRNLFVYIAGNNLDDRLRRTIDDVCDIFRACDVGALMQDFGKFTARNDPFLHFYETFLAEYNPAKRKARGVWYTPEPVVNFIVRAVDDVLKTEFNLPRGIADTSKISIDWDTGQNDPKTGKPLTIKKDVHRVQILDPATGTGTFLAQAIKQIAAQVKDIAPGMWSGYVEENLIPCLHGFELLMASYAMCHMKLDMMLTDMGYKPSSNPPRLGVYLTNSLEEGERVEQTLPFARWLSDEAKGANTIKRDTPIMCVIGNPPYSGESANKGEWIMGLMEAYKKEPGGNERLNEKNSKWINDDYVKFIRFAEYMIQKNGEGILGFITNHGYLDNPTFRGMRWHLLNTFDKIYILDLHGNLKRKETSPDGTADKNVFDIQPGVAIVIGVKLVSLNNARPALSRVYRSDLWGSRQSKYHALWASEIGTPNWTEIAPASPDFNFTDTNEQSSEEYRKGLNLAELMSVGGVGICSKRDPIAYHDTVGELSKVLYNFRDLPSPDITALYNVQTESRDQKVVYAKANVVEYGIKDKYYQKVTYRPFDNRWTYYTDKVRGFLAYPVYDKLRHLTKEHENVALIVGRQGQAVGGDDWNLILATSILTDLNIFRRGGGVTHPLYLYPEEGTLETDRRVNFDPKIYAEIRERAALILPSVSGEGTGVGSVGVAQTSTPHPNPPPEGEGLIPDELRVFDYIYGVLHSPDYRATYAQFLKIDFPRIPYPASPEVFAHIAEKGGELRRLHLMEDAAIGATPYPFKGDGDNVVVKPALSDDGRVMINPGQYFEGVPQIAWEFHIGGYQPAQKWLKDRKGRALSFDDVLHYQKIIKILTETDRIMKEIVLPL